MNETSKVTEFTVKPGITQQTESRWRVQLYEALIKLNVYISNLHAQSLLQQEAAETSADQPGPADGRTSSQSTTGSSYPD